MDHHVERLVRQRFLEPVEVCAVGFGQLEVGVAPGSVEVSSLFGRVLERVEVFDTDHGRAVTKNTFGQEAADEAGGAGHEDA